MAQFDPIMQEYITCPKRDLQLNQLLPHTRQTHWFIEQQDHFSKWWATLEQRGAFLSWCQGCRSNSGGRRRGGNKRRALFKAKLRNTKAGCTHEKESKEQGQSKLQIKQLNKVQRKSKVQIEMQNKKIKIQNVPNGDRRREETQGTLRRTETEGTTTAEAHQIPPEVNCVTGTPFWSAHHRYQSLGRFHMMMSLMALHQGGQEKPGFRWQLCHLLPLNLFFCGMSQKGVFSSVWIYIFINQRRLGVKQ